MCPQRHLVIYRAGREGNAISRRGGCQRRRDDHNGRHCAFGRAADPKHDIEIAKALGRIRATLRGVRVQDADRHIRRRIEQVSIANRITQHPDVADS